MLEVKHESLSQQWRAQGAGAAVGSAGARLVVCEVGWSLVLHKKGLCVLGRGSSDGQP